MKAIIILILLFANGILAQTHTLQLELVNPSVGYPISSDFSSCGATTNDTGLNNIFSNYGGVNYCGGNSFLSYPALTEVSGGLVTCYDCDITSLITNLENYDQVVGRARLTPGEFWRANYLYIKLEIPLVQEGTTASNVIITNNSNLNEIFENFTVYSLSNSVQNWKDLICDCYAPELAQAIVDAGLILPNSTDSSTGQMIYDNYSYGTIGILSNAQNHITQISVGPNPFTHQLHITPSLSAANYFLFDSSGKVIIRSQNVNEVESMSSQLQPGLYILKISTYEGHSETFKIIKR